MVRVPSARSFLPSAVTAALLASACSSCTLAVDYVATDGTVFHKSADLNPSDAARAAVRASAAHDLRCPPDRVTTRDVGRQEYLCDACGQRAHYRGVTEGSGDRYVVRYVLIGRVPLEGAQPTTE
jgi:hypothetical protein